MMDQLAGAASTALGVLVALVLLFLVWRNLRALRRQAEDMQLYPTQPGTPELLEAYTSSGQQIQLAPMSDLDNSPQAKIQERLRVVAEDKPDAIVGLVNGWLREDQRR